MRTLENYLESVQKSHFLLISEAGEDPRVIHRLDPESGCLLVSRLLPAPPPRPLLYGSIPFTHCGDGGPLRGVLLCDLRLSPGSAVWCAPVAAVRLPGGEPFLFTAPDPATYPASAPPPPEEALREAAASFAEDYLGGSAGGLTLEGREQAEALLEKGLLAYRLRRHFRYQQ